MKKFILLFITFILLFQPICIALEQQDTLTPPTWEDVVISGADYEYIEPITHPKWKRPVGIFLCILTFSIVDIPYKMDVKESQIAKNNRQFSKYERIKKQFYNDVQQCDTAFNDKEKLYGCYMQVKQYYHNVLNDAVNQDISRYKNSLLEEQNDLIFRQNMILHRQNRR